MSIGFRSIPEPPPGTPGYDTMMAIKENLEILLGLRKRGSVLKRAARFEDLVDLELITDDEVPST